MRPRTKSVVNVREYFRHDGAGAPELSDLEETDSEDDNWMLIATQGKPSKKNTLTNSNYDSRYNSLAKPKGLKWRERASTVDSWEGTDVEDDMDDDDDDEDDTERLRTCSHDRRISFDDDINIVEIPSRSSFDADYKRRVWYSMEEFHQMRQQF